MEQIHPDLQASVLCEDVRNEIGGLQTLVGIIAAIPAPALPVRFFKLCLWSRWCGGQGNFLQQSFILGPEEGEPIVSAEVKFTLQNMEANATNVNFFGGIQFSNFGIHHVEIHLNKQLRLRFPFNVVQVTGSGQILN